MPTGLNSTELNDFAPAWVSQPNSRGLLRHLPARGSCATGRADEPLGTWDIICSCCFTLSLCVVTAIHMNVGPAGENTLEWFRRKGKWVTIAIVSPEIILYTAGKQWFSASRLCKKLNNSTPKEQAKSPTGTTRFSGNGSQTPPEAVRDRKKSSATLRF